MLIAFKIEKKKLVKIYIIPNPQKKYTKSDKKRRNRNEMIGLKFSFYQISLNPKSRIPYLC
jgi:hypothetical protein